ncbi:MAG TPA: cation:proton antiporter [Chloroflexia bacterium]|nr:cation:proton antiporter [Chloroflexia bacterium]
MSNFELSVRLFAQLFAILVTCRLVGVLARKLGQPQVVGEMIAGILLGPSLFGLLFPQIQQSFFPAQSRSVIYTLSQLGLVLYMFVIGVEFEAGLMRKRMLSAVSVSISGIILPFVLGGALAFFLTGNTVFFGDSVSPWLAALFMGAAMSITAFPMLARIVYERGLAGTSLGTLVLAAGSIDDALAWCILAIVVAGFKSDPAIAILAIGGAVLYVLFCWGVVRKALQPLARQAERRGELSAGAFSFILALVMAGAWLTDAIGVYSVFGAFILGTAMPRGLVSRQLIKRIEPLSTTFLLPLFFVNSGLNTQIGLLNQPFLWLVAATVLIAAIAGKGLGCALAARLSGETGRSALAIGSLMNVRGLMELIALNIGLEQKIINPTLFTVMVIMALITTLMATPLLKWSLGGSKTKVESAQPLTIAA